MNIGIGIICLNSLLFTLWMYRRDKRKTEARDRQARIAELKAEIARIYDETPDCCMCGDASDHSPWYGGHEPVPAWQYFSAPLERKLRALEKQK